MQCQLFDEKSLKDSTEETKTWLKNTFFWHPEPVKCDQCGEDKLYAAHSVENEAVKHVCCDCVAARENWTQERHKIEHVKADLWSVMALFDEPDDLPELEAVD